MAYGNWGAYVYKNGERQTEREDNTPYREHELESGYLQAFHPGRRDGSVRPHHAVLGSGRIRLCAHKSAVVLYVDGAEVDSQELRKQYASHLESDDEGYLWEAEETIYQGKIEEHSFKAKPFDGNMLDLELIEPDGTHWTARAGYAYGSGHHPDSEGNAYYGPYPWKEKQS